MNALTKQSKVLIGLTLLSMTVFASTGYLFFMILSLFLMNMSYYTVTDDLKVVSLTKVLSVGAALNVSVLLVSSMLG